MKGWMVHDDECRLFCRADTRGKARTFWRGYSRYETHSFVAMGVRRAAWLDGPGPAREISCEYSECLGPFDDRGDCIADHRCWEGEYLDREKTLAALSGRAARGEAGGG